MSEELTLLDIESGLIDLYEELESCRTPEEEANVHAAIEAYLKAEVQKVDSVRAYILHEEARARVHREESERQLKLARMCEAHAENVKEFCKRVILQSAEAGGKKVLEGRTGKIRVQGNGGLQALEIYDESALPAEFCPVVVQYVPDNEAIRQALTAGKHVPGAKLLERGSHVRVE